MTDAWTEIESIPAAMAAAVRPSLVRTTRAGYVRFLDAMVHYTRDSGPRLRHAAEHTPEGPVRTFFAALARDEQGHYRLAEADLAALGGAPEATAPDDIAEFHAWWMRADDPAAWLGALYVLESVGAHLAADAVQNLGRLGLGKGEVRFVMVHLEVDVLHGDGARALARGFTGEDAGAMLAAAKHAGDFWVAMHCRALADGTA